MTTIATPLADLADAMERVEIEQQGIRTEIGTLSFEIGEVRDLLIQVLDMLDAND